MRKLSATILLMLFAFIGISQNIGKEYNKTFWKLQKSDSTIFVMTLKIKGDNRFSLTSREGSSKDLLGLKYFIGRIMGRVPSTILDIKGNYSIKNDSILLNGRLHSLYEKSNITGYIKGGAITLKSKPIIKGYQVKDYKAARNYPEVIDSIFAKTKTYLFNPELLTSNEWDRFHKRISKQKHRIKDDFEFTSTFNYLAYRMLPFSHYAVVQKRPQKNTSAGGKSASTQKESKFIIHRINAETIRFQIRSFTATAEEITPYIDTLRGLSIKNLIIDLRGNPGGTIASALPLAEFLVSDTLYGGVFLTQKYFKKHHGNPAIDQYKSFQPFSESNFELIINGIHNHEGLCLVVKPSERRFLGKLFILTDKATASTCEPLVYGLKQTKRATIVGERTCGAMLNGEKFDVSANFSLWIPTADYYTSDGFKIDKVGVKPDIEVDPTKALEKVLEII